MGSVTPLKSTNPGYYERAEALADEITELCLLPLCGRVPAARQDP